MEPQQAPSDRFDLERWLRLFRERGWTIVACVVLVAASAAFFSLTATKVYEAKASLLFRDSQLGADALGLPAPSDSNDPAREAETNVKLVESPAVARRVAEQLHGRLGPQRISQRIVVRPEGQSSVVSVQARDPDPRFAAWLATTYARDYIAVRNQADRSQITRLRRSLQRQLAAMTPAQRASPAGQSLAIRVEQFGVLESLQHGGAELLEAAAVPSAPAYPRTKLNLALGAFVGLLLGVGLALALERLNRRVREADELSEMYGLPLLAEVPESGSLAGDSRTVSGGEREAFRMLRARLRYFNVDREIHSVLITSGTSFEGKSTIAWHLAATMAEASRRPVLLVEADLRRPSVAAARGLSRTPGLSDVLVDDVTFTEAVQHVPVGDAGDGIIPPRTLDVLVAGMAPPNPSELVESQRMADLLQEVGERYEFVVVDSGPTLIVADPLSLMSQVQGVIVVSRVGTTTRRAATALRDQLAAMRAPVLGVVANRVKSSPLPYYGYDTDDDRRPHASNAPAAPERRLRMRSPATGRALLESYRELVRPAAAARTGHRDDGGMDDGGHDRTEERPPEA